MEGDRNDDSDHLPRRGVVPAQRRARPAGRDAARADRGAEGAGLRQRHAHPALPAAGGGDRHARDRSGDRRGLVVRGGRHRSLCEVLPFPRLPLLDAALGRATCNGDHGRRRLRRDAGRSAARGGHRAGRGHAPAVPRGLPGNADGAARARANPDAGDADDDPQHGAACRAIDVDDAGNRRGDGGRHLRHVLARRARLHDRRPVRRSAACRCGDRPDRGIGSRGGARDRAPARRHAGRGRARRGRAACRRTSQLPDRHPRDPAQRRAATSSRRRSQPDCRDGADGMLAHGPPRRAPRRACRRHNSRRNADRGAQPGETSRSRERRAT